MAKATLVTLVVSMMAVALLSPSTVMGADGDDGGPAKQWKPMKTGDVACASNADCGESGQ